MFFVGAAVLFMMLLRNRHNRVALTNAITEKELFHQFEQAAASNAAEESMRTLTKWFDVAGQSNGYDSLSQFIAMFGDSTLQNQFSALEACVYGKQNERWSGKVLSRQLAGARKKCLRRPASVHSRHALGPLNP